MDAPTLKPAHDRMVAASQRVSQMRAQLEDALHEAPEVVAARHNLENARIAMAKQPSVVDARSQTQFILDRTNSILEMGYIKKKPGRDAINWTILEQAIAGEQGAV